MAAATFARGTAAAGGFNFFNKTASTFIDEGMFVSVPDSFHPRFLQTVTHPTSSMNLLHGKHCKLCSSSCSSTDCLQKAYIPIKRLR